MDGEKPRPLEMTTRNKMEQGEAKKPKSIITYSNGRTLSIEERFAEVVHILHASTTRTAPIPLSSIAKALQSNTEHTMIYVQRLTPHLAPTGIRVENND